MDSFSYNNYCINFILIINFIINMKNVLLIIDPQVDFCEGGVLKVKEANEKLSNLVKNLDNYDFIAIIMDSHLDTHCSFKENGGSLPKHCVLFSEGWELFPELNDVLFKYYNIIEFYRKGIFDDENDIFNNKEDGLILYYDLKKLEDIKINICGIDNCILETIKSLLNYFSSDQINILTQYIASNKIENLINYAKENAINYEN